MDLLSSDVLETIKVDLDLREDVIRKAVYAAMATLPEPDLCENIVASYFVWANNLTPHEIGKEICYHMTSGVRHAEPGTLLDECTGKIVDCVTFDKPQRCGLVRIAFPLKMLLDEKGDIYSSSVLHIVAGAGILALLENRDAKLVDVAISDEIIAKFPGPAYGAKGLRKLTNFGDEIAFGTILKPCTGITPEQEAQIVKQAAGNPMFLFIKEDENFLPGAPFAPVAVRAKKAVEAIAQAKATRGDVGLVFASHITAPPQLICDYAKAVLDAGVNGLMFSEYYCGGAVRMIREMTKDMDTPPPIYGHNGGITARVRHIYREVLDMFARLDGIDFRQTAPLISGLGLLRPFGLEWRKCEEMLTRPMAGKPAVMVARAGGLDQGNIIQNLDDVSKGAGVENYLFLAGSAINAIKGASGKYEPAIGAEAMQQALQLFKDGAFSDPAELTPADVKAYADSNALASLSAAVAQRYGL